MSKRFISILALFGLVITFTSGFSKDRGLTNTSESPHVELRSLDIGDVRWTEGFWADKFRQCHEVMVPHMWDILSDPDIGHAWQNFRIAAGLEKGEFKGTWWHDGDFYKLLESAAHVYAVTGDKQLDRLMDEAIKVIAKAQQQDGYISTPIIIGQGLMPQVYEEGIYSRYEQNRPWQDLFHHELYNLGHLMTAACIHHRVTGKTSFLDVAKRVGDHLYDTFASRDPRLAHFGFNPSNIMGCVELYRTTRDKKYLELAGIFVDMRGSLPGGSELNQARTPLREETRAVGHSVTGAYLYSGALDVYAETGEQELYDAVRRIWENVAFKKTYITGATSALHHGVSSARDDRVDIVHEAYGLEYQMPGVTAYNETCANIANAMWNWRFLAITGESRHADILETVVFNSALSGINFDGTEYIYTNPLRWHGEETDLLKMDFLSRQPYLHCFCCPPNIVRTIAKLAGWAYCVSDKGLWLNLYGGNEVNTKLPDGTSVSVKQETDYPWDGEIKLTVRSAQTGNFSIFLRIPQWAKGASIRVNGREIQQNIPAGRYYEIDRKWGEENVIELDLPMRVQLVKSNPKVEETRNQVAVRRGPVVYCLESVDLPDGVRVSDVYLPADVRFESVFEKNLLGGVFTLIGEGFLLREGEWKDRLYDEWGPVAKEKIEVKLIPYYAWNNRGISHMTVWMPIDL